MKLDIYNKTGKKSTKKLTLSDSVFGIEPNEHSVYLAVNSELAALRQGTHSSKTRAEVSGGGTKPYKQKGTGRARVGSFEILQGFMVVLHWAQNLINMIRRLIKKLDNWHVGACCHKNYLLEN